MIILLNPGSIQISQMPIIWIQNAIKIVSSYQSLVHIYVEDPWMILFHEKFLLCVLFLGYAWS